ncbi:MAG: VCBS domain-containing protein, partial [Hyphomicrobiaceae bacterium]
MAVRTGNDSNNWLFGTFRNDEIYGLGGNDKLFGLWGNDTLDGGQGRDKLFGGFGNDDLTGGSGNDKVYGGFGHDTLRYVSADNTGDRDFYDGGHGNDTLALALTKDEWLSIDVQSDIADYLTFLDDNTRPNGEANGRSFEFSAFDLKARKIENLTVTVDGIEQNPIDEAVVALDDVFTVDEYGVLSGNVLADNGNGIDIVPDLVAEVEVVDDVTAGELVFNEDGSFTYDPQAAYNHLTGSETATETFTYRVTDADGDSDEATATITINAVGPAATDQTYAPGNNLFTNATPGGDPEGSRVSSVANDGSQLQITSGGQVEIDGEFGTLTINADGSYSYDLDGSSAAYQALGAGAITSDVFTYTFEDAAGNATSADLTINIAATDTSYNDILYSGPPGADRFGVPTDGICAVGDRGGNMPTEFFDNSTSVYYTLVPEALSENPLSTTGNFQLTVASDVQLPTGEIISGGIVDIQIAFALASDCYPNQLEDYSPNMLDNDPLLSVITPNQIVDIAQGNITPDWFVDYGEAAGANLGNGFFYTFTYDGYDAGLNAIYSAEAVIVKLIGIVDGGGGGGG